MDQVAIAEVCHEVNRAYCASIGDISQKSWDEAEGWQRQSAVMGVEFAIMNPTAPASAQHNSWMQQKVSDGWVYGPVKDAVKKQHPCIVEYDKLPHEQRVKDVLFQAVVKACVKARS